jgi:RNA polymerase sigma factor (sigma-70 family)
MTNITVPDASTTEATVRLAAAGDEVAFAWLVSEHHAAMVRVAFVIVSDTEVALDATQSAWAIAWRRLHTLREPERVGTWLVAIAANEARLALRRQRRHNVVEIPAVAREPHGQGRDDPALAIDGLDLDRALRGLKPEERSLLAMRYVAGYDSTEIGRLEGTSASGVRSRLSRLLDRLRTELDHA